jgi:cyclic dehypoxanthinyl futalosine synthase
MSERTGSVLEKAKSGARLTDAEALALFGDAGLPDLGEAAHAVRRRLHPGPVVTYIVDRNVNYANACVTGCAFCAFHRPPGHPEEYVLSREALAEKIRETKAAGGVQILLQGGNHPTLRLEWYEDLLRFMKSFDIHVHGFSPPEIRHFADLNGLPVREVLVRLRAAGLDSVPGGGAEILVDRVRQRISPRKAAADQWLEVMEEAHGLGLKTTATMVFGHVETPADRVEHLRRLREQQERSLARGNGGGYTAFICWSLQTEHTGLAGMPSAGGHDYLKTLAVARLYLDNFPNVQASWVTQGEKVAQLALLFGANDMGSTMMEENVVRPAGADFRMTEARIRAVIEDLGFVPRRRNQAYELLEA